MHLNLLTYRSCKNGSCTARFPLLQNLIVAQLANNLQHFIVLLPFVCPSVCDTTLVAEHFVRFSWIRYRHGASTTAVQTFIVTYFTPIPCFTPYLRSWKIGRKSRRRILLSSHCVDCNNYGTNTVEYSWCVVHILWDNVFRPNCGHFQANNIITIT